ncbi:zinc ribbon domain-containing protein [bacterium]|nr:zinc ribbon domain-containing protein [bacterium]
MECASCKKSVPNKGEETCPHCGQEFVKRCDKCGILYPEDMNFCNQCGSKLVTVLFALDEDDQIDIESMLSDAGVVENENPQEVVEEIPKEEKPKKKKKKGKKEKKAESSSDTMMAPPPSIAGGSEKDFSYVDKIVGGNLKKDGGSVSEMDFVSGEAKIEEGSAESDDDLDIPISVDEVLRKNIKDIPLTPVRKATKRTIELSNLDAHMSTLHGDSFLLLQNSAIENLQKGSGGFYSFEGSSGAGKEEIIQLFESFIEQTTPENITVISSEASEYDFDYMIFIHLLRSLLKISELETASVAKQITALLGKTLPTGKVNALAALLSLNFTPLNTKLPKDDIDYLISHVIYATAKKQPILWFVRNASAINRRTMKFFVRLKKVFNFVPVAIVFVSASEAEILHSVDSDHRFEFNGFSKDVVVKKVEEMLAVNRLPVDIEKVLQKFSGNLLASTQMIEFLKELKLIFKMRDSWRFSKLPEDFVAPKTLEDVINNRLSFLPVESSLLLRRLVLLNLHRIPIRLYIAIFGEEFDEIQRLNDSGFIAITEENIAFPSRTILSILKKKMRIGEEERAFYRMVVDKIAHNMNELPDINTRWLLLSYINLAGRIGVAYNSFLYSSAVYMEKLGFFGVAQRSYQTILQSFSADDLHDDMSWLLSIKNARLMRFIEKKWARTFWQRLLDKAKKQQMMHIILLSEGNLLLLDEEQLDLRLLVGVMKKMHEIGCLEDELILIDRAVDILLESNSLQDAYTLALRGYTILYDSLAGNQAEDPQQLPLFIYTLYLRSSSQLAEVCITMEQFEFATKVLTRSLEMAKNRKSHYFVAKILLLIVKINYFSGGNEWESSLKEGFEYAMKGMEFKILRAFFLFLEENSLEELEWLEPYLECKNWLNL